MRIAYVCSSKNLTAKVFHRANALIKYICSNFDADIIDIGMRPGRRWVGAIKTHALNVSIVCALLFLKAIARTRFLVILRAIIENIWVSLAFFPLSFKEKYDVLMFYEPMYAFIPLFLKKRFRIFVYERSDHYPSAFQGVMRSSIELLDSYCIKKAHLVVCVSEALAKEARLRGAKKVIVSYNGVYINEFKSLFTNSIEKKRKKKTIVFIGNLIYPRWGVDFLLHAFEYCLKLDPMLRLVIVGEGPLRADLEELANNLRIKDRVEFKGYVPHNDIPSILADACVAVAPYKPSEHTKYAGALKILEYMAAGLPFVVTDVGPFVNIVKENNAGLVVPYDTEAFGKALLRLINDKRLRESIGRNGKKAASNYDWNILLKKEFESVKSILESTGE